MVADTTVIWSCLDRDDTKFLWNIPGYFVPMYTEQNDQEDPRKRTQGCKPSKIWYNHHLSLTVSHLVGQVLGFRDPLVGRHPRLVAAAALAVTGKLFQIPGNARHTTRASDSKLKWSLNNWTTQSTNQLVVRSVRPSGCPPTQQATSLCLTQTSHLFPRSVTDKIGAVSLTILSNCVKFQKELYVTPKYIFKET